jgi:hypothetical protein
MPRGNDSFYSDFYPRGFRKFFAIGVICLTTLVPAVAAWKDAPGPIPPQGPAFGPRFPGPRGFPARQQGDQPSLVSRVLQAGRILLAAFGSILGLMIYYPRSGFKRYALLCGPALGIGSFLLLNWYLTGRVKVYRFEAVFAALLGGLPGVLLYIFLARRKWYGRQRSEALWIE